MLLWTCLSRLFRGDPLIIDQSGGVRRTGRNSSSSSSREGVRVRDIKIHQLEQDDSAEEEVKSSLAVVTLLHPLRGIRGVVDTASSAVPNRSRHWGKFWSYCMPKLFLFQQKC